METGRKTGVLFVVATPLGNLDDLSPRAGETLARVQLIGAEDTRRTGRLLSHLGIEVPMVAYHEHSDVSRLDRLLSVLESGGDVALVSDAGTPLLSDPGFELVREAQSRGLAVIPIPGPSAITAALSVAGLPTDRFLFAGFPPAKAGARRTFLAELSSLPSTLVLFESCHRIAESVAELAAQFGGSRRAFLGRELTKLHESYLAGTLAELGARLRSGEIPARGEFVVVVAGAGDPGEREIEQEARRLLTELLPELPVSRAARVAAKLTGLTRSRCFELAEALRRDAD